MFGLRPEGFVAKSLIEEVAISLFSFYCALKDSENNDEEELINHRIFKTFVANAF